MIKLNIFYLQRKLKVSNKSLINSEKVHRVIKFNKKARLNPYIDMNTKLRKKQKAILRKVFSS